MSIYQRLKVETLGLGDFAQSPSPLRPLFFRQTNIKLFSLYKCFCKSSVNVSLFYAVMLFKIKLTLPRPINAIKEN